MRRRDERMKGENYRMPRFHPSAFSFILPERGGYELFDSKTIDAILGR